MHTISIILSPRRTVFRKVAIATSFAALTALGAQVAIRLPFSPVPVTLQVLAVMITGLALGSRHGFASQLGYLAVGAAGMPVFASGNGGLPYLLGPTGGYLMAFPLAAFAAGWVRERLDRQGNLGLALASLATVAIIYASGVAWLAQWLQVSLPQAWHLGAAPFIAADLVKAACAVATVGTSRSVLSRWIDLP